MLASELDIKRLALYMHIDLFDACNTIEFQKFCVATKVNNEKTLSRALIFRDVKQSIRCRWSTLKNCIW